MRINIAVPSHNCCHLFLPWLQSLASSQWLFYFRNSKSYIFFSAPPSLPGQAVRAESCPVEAERAACRESLSYWDNTTRVSLQTPWQPVKQSERRGGGGGGVLYAVLYILTPISRWRSWRWGACLVLTSLHPSIPRRHRHNSGKSHLDEVTVFADSDSSFVLLKTCHLTNKHMTAC